MRMGTTWWSAAVGALLVACGGSGQEAGNAPPDQRPPSAAKIRTGQGFNLEKKTIRVGALNDESGPAATIGKPYAVGKRMVAQRVSAGGTGWLPDGWTIELIERDHGYDPKKAVEAYEQIKDDVALIVTSFGTPNTMPLWPKLKRDNLIALPASYSSEMAKHPSTPPPGPSYMLEAMRAMDFVVAQADTTGSDRSAIKAAIVYQQDDYGADGLRGWKEAASYHGVDVVSEQTVKAGQRNFATVVAGLSKAGATHVMLTVLPSASAPILSIAAQRQYRPMWLGQSPSWVDRFFDPEIIPAAVFDTFILAFSMPFWGEDLPGMKEFLEAYERYGRAESNPDNYILSSYLQGLTAVEILRRAIKAGDVTRTGIRKARDSIRNWRPGGMGQPINLGSVPYVTATRVRMLAPDFVGNTWNVVGDYMEPKALAGRRRSHE